ncbi:putative aldo-keto reductase 1 [Prunus yedoensis var. nudiflora]|uniref:Putative aldo-keto reductase 1 n=1 Tax=Prunus yedoensis var. nudiflora TaxID=2094558 RepID=A0A314ZF92_PRUYE|nr:putative aldo-keto reductase 1 [Prunus yedoensis var. nudiflora]
MAEDNTIEIPRVKLGNQGLEVSKLGFGCMGLTGVYNSPVADEDGISIIKDAFSKGITFFDTSDVYGPHLNEVLIGKALKQLPREKIQLATKFGITGTVDPPAIAIKGTPDAYRETVKKHQSSPAQLALAWVLHQGDDVVPILGTTKIKNLDTNIGSLRVKLGEEDLKQVSDAILIDQVAGNRTYLGMTHLQWNFANTPPKV